MYSVIYLNLTSDEDDVIQRNVNILLGLLIVFENDH